MPSVASHYRIRSFSNLPPKSDIVARSGDKNSDGLMGQVIRALGHPRITDLIHHCTSLDRLNNAWPTFSYFQAWPRPRPIKIQPLHLAPYMEFAHEHNPAYPVGSILREVEKQEKLDTALSTVLTQWAHGRLPIEVNAPIACALASHLFSGSRWFRKHRGSILNRILESDTACYIALASGPFDHDKRLVERLVADPRFVLELVKSPGLRHHQAWDWYKRQFAEQPVLASLHHFLEGDERQALSLLQHAAEDEPVAAGMCLSLMPHHLNAKCWLDTISGNNEAWYWAGKIWVQENPISRFPYHRVALSQLNQSAHWLYHWARDIDPVNASDHAQKIWPDPWAVELAVDQCFPKDTVLELFRQKELDTKHPVEGAIILWAADYTST